MKEPLLYRAGLRAIARLRRDGVRRENVRVVAGSASGPRWLALVGIDRALIGAGLGAVRGPGPTRLLVGASAGAWRMMAFAGLDPEATHARLVRAYIRKVFPRGVRPTQVSATYDAMLREVFPADDVRAILDREDTDVALHVARLRGPFPWRSRAVQWGVLGAATGLSAFGAPVTDLLAQRVLAHTRPERLRPRFAGATARLTADNLLAVALASGTVPIHMEPRSAIPGLPRGVYVDGGLADYHLRQPFVAPGEGIVLFPHFQERIEASWFAGDSRARREEPEAVADVLQIFPSPEFVAGLPGGRLPVTEDFFEFVDAPETRIARWSEVAARSELLGEALLRDLETGDWLSRLVPIGRSRLV